jgi:hypothetical protein
MVHTLGRQMAGLLSNSHYLNVLHTNGVHGIGEGRETYTSRPLNKVTKLRFELKFFELRPHMISKGIDTNHCSLLRVSAETFEGAEKCTKQGAALEHAGSGARWERGLERTLMSDRRRCEEKGCKKCERVAAPRSCKAGVNAPAHETDGSKCRRKSHHEVTITGGCWMR